MRRGCFGALVCSANYEKNYGTYETFENGLRMPHPYVKEEKKSGSRNENDFCHEPSEKKLFFGHAPMTQTIRHYCAG